MSDTPYKRLRDFHGSASGKYRVLASDTGLIPLVQTIPQHTIYVQTIHIEVTTPTASEVWTFQDGVGVPLTRGLSAAAVAHFDFDFGPNGLPCAAATRFVLNITGAVGAVGWITWEAYKLFTLGASYAQAVLDLAPLGYWRLDERGGTVAKDAIGAHDGTYVGGTALTVGVPPLIADGRAMQLTPPDAAAIAGVSIANFGIPRYVTIEAIVKPLPGVGTSFARIWSSGSAVGFPIELSVNANSNIVAVFLNCIGGAPAWAPVGLVEQFRRWHLAVTWDEIALLAYINGVLVYRDTTDAGRSLQGIGVPTGLRYIGSSESGQTFSGVVDELAFLDKALPLSVIAAHSTLAIGTP